VKAIANAIIVVLAAIVSGCGSKSDSAGASVELRVIAEPKTGVHEVTAYDPPSVRAAATGAFEHVDYSFLPNIIVWLVPAGESRKLQLGPVTINIDPAQPSEEIAPVTVGQKIVFHNAGAKPLSLYSVSDGNDFELSVAPDGKGEYVTRGEGLIEVLNDPSEPPIALLYVAPSPWVARAHSGQKITFDHLPPGQYQAVAWHPRLPGSSISLSLVDGLQTTGTLRIGVNALAPTTFPSH
jgi:hypothetical protein